MLIGEVHTGLLQHSTALDVEQAARLLSLVEGANVLSSQRPTAYALSPEIPAGVDCMLPSVSGRKVRGVGAVLSRALLSGGRIAQASTSAQVERSAAGRRLPWSHYIARAGRLESIGKLDRADLINGFLHPKRPSPGAANDSLDLAGIASRLLDRVQSSEHLDRRPPFRSRRLKLRWAVTVDERFAANGSALFTVESDSLRTVEMALGPADAAGAQGLCEDLALHDWLLTTLARIVETATSSPYPAAQKATTLRPVVEHLLHLWMPGARVDTALLPVWDVIERRPGFTRQWASSVDWIRDQIAAGTMELLQNQSLTKT